MQIFPRYCITAPSGGGTTLAILHHAASAITTGMCNTVLITMDRGNFYPEVSAAMTIHQLIEDDRRIEPERSRTKTRIEQSASARSSSTAA